VPGTSVNGGGNEAPERAIPDAQRADRHSFLTGADSLSEEKALFKEGQLVRCRRGRRPAGLGGRTVARPDSLARTQCHQQCGEAADAAAQATDKAKLPDDSGKEMAWQGKFKDCLARAKDEFDRQDYLQAENSFKEALGYSPDDCFALSNLGVVEFQLGKLKEAEEALTKASQKKTDSSFALTTLGIVNYRQERLGDAERRFARPSPSTSRISPPTTISESCWLPQGREKPAKSEIMKAIEINKNYADAHFNLAVIYATGKPPSKMMAKKHYAKALELGAPPDPSLEKLVQ